MIFLLNLQVFMLNEIIQFFNFCTFEISYVTNTKYQLNQNDVFVFSFFTRVIFHRIFKSSSQNIVMGNSDYNKNPIQFGRTYRADTDIDSTNLTIPNDLAKELDIENCKVSIAVLRDFKGRKHLLISKYCREILLD